MDIYYNPLDPRCKSVTGAVQQNIDCRIMLFAENAGHCELILRRDGEEAQSYPMHKVAGGWCFVLSSFLRLSRIGSFWSIRKGFRLRTG